MSKMAELDAAMQQIEEVVDWAARSREVREEHEARIEEAVISDLIKIGFLTPEDVETYRHAKKYLCKQGE